MTTLVNAAHINIIIWWRWLILGTTRSMMTAVVAEQRLGLCVVDTADGRELTARVAVVAVGRHVC